MLICDPHGDNIPINGGDEKGLNAIGHDYHISENNDRTVEDCIYCIFFSFQPRKPKMV
jgi:hypothetical protein